MGQMGKLQECRPVRVVECLRAQLTRLNKAIQYLCYSGLTSLNETSNGGDVEAVKVIVSDHESLLVVHRFASVHGAAHLVNEQSEFFVPPIHRVCAYTDAPIKLHRSARAFFARGDEECINYEAETRAEEHFWDEQRDDHG